MPSSIPSLRHSAEQSQDDINRWLDLCEAAERGKDYASVLYAGDALARLAPHNPQPHYIRGLALQHLNRLDDSVAAYLQTTQYDPAYLNAWLNLAYVHQALNQLPQAVQACRRAIAIGGQAIDEDALDTTETIGGLHWNLAVLELLQGDLRRGFARFPARYDGTGMTKKRPAFARPLWRGENLRGKTLLVTVDQGHGDTLMMARFLPVLRQQGARIILQAQPGLIPLLSGWDGVDHLIAAGTDPLPDFDYHCNEFDLPRLLRVTLDIIPGMPYLPCPAPTDATRLPPSPPLKIGLTWAGAATHVNDAQRSIPLSCFAPLMEVPNIAFYALNRDKRPGDDALLAAWPITDLAPRLTDFAATAQIIAQLDLVISCDTSIAHLAGGMGRKLWVALPFAPSWCWLMNRSDSPWYPTARLFRQPARGDWAEVIAAIKAELPSASSPASTTPQSTASP